MEDKMNILNYEAPSLEELYLCPIVQGGASKVGDLNEDENAETNKNSETDW